MSRGQVQRGSTRDKQGYQTLPMNSANYFPWFIFFTSGHSFAVLAAGSTNSGPCVHFQNATTGWLIFTIHSFSSSMPELGKGPKQAFITSFPIVSPLDNLRTVAQTRRGDSRICFTLICLCPEDIFCTVPSDHPDVSFGACDTTNFFNSTTICLRRPKTCDDRVDEDGDSD